MDLRKAHLGSFYLAVLLFTPFSLPIRLFSPSTSSGQAADLAIKLHVDGGQLHADLRHGRAHFSRSGWLPDLLNCALLVRRIDISLAFWSA